MSGKAGQGQFALEEFANGPLARFLRSVRPRAVRTLPGTGQIQAVLEDDLTPQ